MYILLPCNMNNLCTWECTRMTEIQRTWTSNRIKSFLQSKAGLHINLYNCNSKGIQAKKKKKATLSMKWTVKQKMYSIIGLINAESTFHFQSTEHILRMAYNEAKHICNF